MRLGYRLRVVALLGVVVANAKAQHLAPEFQSNNDVEPLPIPIRLDGLERLKRNLAAPTEAPRLLAYREIGFRNDRRSLALLAAHLEQPELELSPLSQLTVARALSPGATTPAVYRLLLRHAFTVAMLSNPQEPLQRLAVETSLLGLAKVGSQQCVIDLGRALATTGILAEAATAALLVYPPAPATRLLHPSVKRSPALLRVLGRLQVTEAIDWLRQQLLGAPQELQLAAAIALIELNDPEMPPLLKRWAADPNTPAEFRALTRIRPKDNTTVIGSNFLPVRLDQDKLTLALLQHFSSVPTRLPTVETLRRALSSHNDVTRWLAAALLSSISPTQVVPFVRSKDAVIRRAIDWALPYLAPDSPLIAAILPRLAQSRPSIEPLDWYGCLIHPQIQDQLPARFIRELAHSNTPYAPFGAEALAARLSPIVTAEVRRFINSTDPRVRAAVAQGLGRATLPFATGLLLTRYDVEADPVVRRAIVRALRIRNARLAQGLLYDVARFDPDRLTRQLAKTPNVDQPPTEGFSDPFERAFVAHLALPQSWSNTQRSPLDAAKSKPVAFRLRVPGTETHARLMGPLGRSLSVPLDPRGLLLIAGNPQFLTLSPSRPLNTVPEPQD